MSELSERVQGWLTEEERNQAYLARKAGIGESYLSMILSGQRKPGARALGKLEKAMGLEPGTLVSLRNAEDWMSKAELEEDNHAHRL